MGPRSVTERPPRRLVLIAFALLVWLVVPWGLILGTTVRGGVVLGVCVVFSLVAFGISYISVSMALRRRRVRRRESAFGSGVWGAAQQFATHTGKLPMNAAAVQFLLVPGAVAVGFTALALIDVVVRT